MASILKVKGKWRAQVRQKGQPVLTRTFSTKVLAAQWARQVEADHDTGRATTKPEQKPVTFATLIDRYADEVGKIKPLGKSKKNTHALIKRYLGDVDACTITTDRLVRYITEERRVANVTAGIDLTYIKGVLKIAKALWREPVQPSIVDDTREILRYMGMVFQSNERDRRPTAGELAAIRSFLARHNLFKPDILDFIIASCFRPPSEVLRLRWDDLNHADKTIIIRDRKDPRKKIGNHQTVPLLHGSYEIILRQPQVSEYIFPLAHSALSNTWLDACKELKIEDLHLYDMRHEAISRLVEAKKHSLAEMMLVTGHKNPKQLMRYTQLRARDLHR